MNERLIELLEQKSCAFVPCENECHGCHNVEMYDDQIEALADYLLANGVIVPLCKVGDYLFYPWVYGGISGIAILEVDAIKVYVEGRSLVFFKNPESDMPMPSYFREEDFGKTVFFTREEAEKVLAERTDTDGKAD